QPGSGSCLLDDALNPIGASLARFFWLWDGAAAHQDMDTLRHAMKIGRDNHRKRPKRRSHPVDSWRHDLDLEITEGWTAHGQTNHLLKTIACYGHVILKLSGFDLEQHIIDTAPRLPGYQQHCGHQDNLRQRAHDWAVTVEKLYWPAGTHPKALHVETPTINVQRAEDACDRISKAVQQLLSSGHLPQAISQWAKQVTEIARCSFKTLYKYPNLWHPAHCKELAQGCVNHSTSTISEKLDTLTLKPADPPNPDKFRALHTQARSMKCEGHDSDFSKNNHPDRGVRGDEVDFPQAAASEVSLDLLDDFTHGCHRQLQRLGWNVAQLVQFIAERFNGKRRAQLSDDELVSLLYQLQALERG
ncbi:hypothetical protein C7271_05945, partial [filamentous cyanobacterium CCP5]